MKRTTNELRSLKNRIINIECSLLNGLTAITSNNIIPTKILLLIFQENSSLLDQDLSMDGEK